MVVKVPVRIPSSDAPRVSVIIVAWRSAPYLDRCLTRLAEANISTPYEVVLGLNEPNEEVRSYIEDSVRGVEHVSTRVNLGYGAIVNRAAQIARGEYLVLLNDDTEVHDGWLEPLVETADRRPKLGVVGSRLVFGDGSVQESGALLWSDGSATNVARGQARNDPRYQEERRVDYCSACSLLVRRSTWDRIGGFDDAFFPAYYEDVDLCMRVRQSGEEVWVQPRSEVFHQLSASTSGAYRSFLLDRNREIFAERWADELAARPEPPREGDDLAIARAVWRSAGQPPPVLFVYDSSIAESALEDATARLEAGAQALLESTELEITALDLGEAATLGIDDSPWSLVMVAVPALGWLGALGGDAPVLLDGEILRTDSFIVDAARAAELRAVGDADFVACVRDETAEALGLVREDARAVGQSVLYAPGSSAGPEPQRPGRAGGMIAPRPAGIGSKRRELDRTSGLDESEQRSLDRALEVQEEFAAQLESNIRQLLADVDRRDEAVAAAEAYASSLKDQVEAQARSIAEKDAYIKEKEADILRLIRAEETELEQRQRDRAAARRARNLSAR
jgi:GT2 family glycosyltransferase